MPDDDPTGSPLLRALDARADALEAAVAALQQNPAPAGAPTEHYWAGEEQLALGVTGNVGLTVDTAAASSGTDVTLAGPYDPITFVDGGVYTVTMHVEVKAGLDAGVMTSGTILFTSSGLFNDPWAALEPTPLVSYTHAATLSYRRHFDAGETLSAEVRPDGTGGTHATVRVGVWVVSG